MILKKKITFRSINNWLHLWLGLISGAIMMVVCLMACLWVFQQEITDLIVPQAEKQFIVAQQKPLVSPSRVLAIADSLYPNDYVRQIRYERERPVMFKVDMAIPDTAKKVEPVEELVHPYTGEYLGRVKALTPEEKELRKSTNEFFYWALRGHRFLWLPWKIGRPIVNYGTLLFTITLISGLIWWYPKKWTKSTREKSFKIKWKAGWKRVNLDLHNVLGFYSMLIVLALSLTGMVYGIQWYSKALFWSTNWGQVEPERKRLQSDTTQANSDILISPIIDKELSSIIKKHNDFERFTVRYPDTSRNSAVINVNADKYTDRYYANQSYTFDQYTGRRIPNNNPMYDKLFSENTTGEQIRRLNYDIHVGSVLGLPTKILAFFATLIAGSLPITGFIVWYNRKWGKKKGTKKSKRRKIEVENDTERVVTELTEQKSSTQTNKPIRFRPGMVKAKPQVSEEKPD